MRKFVLALAALGAGMLVQTAASEAKVVRVWDNDQHKFMDYDTANQGLYSGGLAYSPIAKEEIDYKGPYGPNTIVVSTPERRLYWIYAPGKAIKYGIGVGKDGFTWAGTNQISRKAEWPDWTPPPQMRLRVKDLPASMPGGIDNPLGARALYLGNTLFRIHGSNEPWSIGQAVSSGCIRMTNDDVIDLYQRVAVGTKVVVMQ